jgi:hypothetical protein
VTTNVARFSAPAGPLTYSFEWQPGTVSFETVQNANAAKQGRVIAEQTFSSGVPVPGEESLHMDLYLFGNAANPIRKRAEVIIDRFEYLP